MTSRLARSTKTIAARSFSGMGFGGGRPGTDIGSGPPDQHQAVAERLGAAEAGIEAGEECLRVSHFGEAGVRLYSAGQPGGARSDKLLWQARLALHDAARLRIVREMYRRRFNEDAPSRRSIDQLRGIEGARVRKLYEILAQQNGVKWSRRQYDRKDWEAGDTANRCLSAATSCLHGLCEAAVLAAGYAPAIGFLHTGKPRSFVYDIADLYKMETVVPQAFKVAGKAAAGKLDMPAERAVRIACRDSFRQGGLLSKIIPDIEAVLTAGDLPKPEEKGAVGPAFEDEKGLADDGHRDQ
jgi:CRISP-associated protein Cas1